MMSFKKIVLLCIFVMNVSLQAGLIEQKVDEERMNWLIQRIKNKVSKYELSVTSYLDKLLSKELTKKKEVKRKKPVIFDITQPDFGLGEQKKSKSQKRKYPVVPCPATISKPMEDMLEIVRADRIYDRLFLQNIIDTLEVDVFASLGNLNIRIANVLDNADIGATNHLQNWLDTTHADFLITMNNLMADLVAVFNTLSQKETAGYKIEQAVQVYIDKINERVPGYINIIERQFKRVHEQFKKLARVYKKEELDQLNMRLNKLKELVLALELRGEAENNRLYQILRYEYQQADVLADKIYTSFGLSNDQARELFVSELYQKYVMSKVRQNYEMVKNLLPQLRLILGNNVSKENFDVYLLGPRALEQLQLSEQHKERIEQLRDKIFDLLMQISDLKSNNRGES